jgi:hypothetical protein
MINPVPAMKMIRRYGVVMISMLCIAACIADLISLYVLGRKFPGFSQVTDTISLLGSTESPVSNIASAWWIILGIIFIVFAAGFFTEFRVKKCDAMIAGILIAIYGTGEGMGSGLFKITHSMGVINASTIIHDAIGSVGILAIIALPLVIMRVITREENRSFYRFSAIIFIVGIVSSFFFLLRYSGDGFFNHYKGLWQRITLVNTYVYFVVVSVMMVIRNFSRGDSR